MFGINIIDTASVGSSGLSATRLAEVKASITAAAEVWGRHIDAPNAVIDVELTLDDIPGSSLATAGAFYSSTGGPFESIVTQEFAADNDISPGIKDATLRIDLPKVLDSNFYFYDTSFEPDPAGLQFSQFDFLSVMVHEFAHILGLSIASNFETPFAAMTQVIDGVTYFTGANAKAANGGQNVALSGSHLEEEDLLDHSAHNGERGTISAVHIGMWEDIGVPIVEATAAADTLYGFELADDTINGLGGNDVIRGLTGDDTLNGAAGDDTIIGGEGVDTMTGGTGADTFEFGVDDEGGVITDFTADDNLTFATAAQAQTILDSATQSGTTAELTVNGTTLSLNSVDTAQLVRTGSQITIDETAGSSGPSMGDDTYNYAKADGALAITLAEEDATSGANDRLVFSDLDLADVTFSQSGTDLSVAWQDGAQSGTVTLADGGSHIELYEFADGSVVSSIDVEFFGTADRLLGTAAGDRIVGTAGQEFVIGGDGADILDAGGTDGGVQYLYGQDGGDTYQVGKANGSVRMVLSGENDAIHSGSDTLEFVDLALADVNFNELSTGDLRLFWNDGTDSGNIQLAEGGKHIESFKFSDGSEVSSISVNHFGTADRLIGTDAGDRIVGSNASEYIIGGDGSDTIDAGGTNGGVQYVFGQDGGDTYQLGKANGSVRMVLSGENDAVHSGSDTLEFLDLALEDVNFTTVGNDELRIFWNDGTDSGNIQLAEGGKHIERFEFSDGSVVSSISVNHFGTADRLIGTGADDRIVGSNAREYVIGGDGADIIDAGDTNGGVQLVFGQDGGDTYLVGKENGSVRMVLSGENDAVHSGTDTLTFTDLNQADLTISNYGSTDVRLTWDTGIDSGYVQLADGGQHIEQFAFADGSMLTYDEYFI